MQAEDSGAQPRVPSIKSALMWILVGGFSGGILGVLMLLLARQFQQSGLGVNISIVFLSLLIAGFIAGPWQRHQFGGSFAAAIAFAILMAASYITGLPIDVQKARPFQVQFLAGLGFLSAVAIGAAAASPWASQLRRKNT